MKVGKLIATILAVASFLAVAVQRDQAQEPLSKPGRTAYQIGSSPNPSTLLARVWRTPRSGFKLMPSNRYAGVPVAAASSSNSAVHGSGTVGKISMWVDVRPNGDSSLGDSIITQSNGNIGIGLNTPMSKLSVQGMIETTLGGYKFPDGTVQTTAAVSGLQFVFHDTTLKGDGTAGSPLGLAVPLNLTGTALTVLTVKSSDIGHAIRAMGGMGSNGVIATGGEDIGFGGVGVEGFGGSSQNGRPGVGVFAAGGSSESGNGASGIDARGGQSQAGEGGIAILATGGISDTAIGGIGVVANGGRSLNLDDAIPGATAVQAVGAPSLKSDGGTGVEATGGAHLNTIVSGDGGNGVAAVGGDTENGIGGHGVVATGGSAAGGTGGNGVVAAGANFNGRGVVATGGVGPAGHGVEATGGASTGSGSTAGIGVVAKGGPSSGSNSESGFGLLAVAGDATNGAMRGRAGQFQGDVFITDNLTVAGSLDVQGSKHFKIDHPLDPENKYLLHASVESSEVLNLYSGNAITNANGEAVVTLPDWFEALNSDVRYQLTVIGTFAQAIVSQKVRQHRFTIKTSLPNVEVSWQVTGVRSDPAMRRHPFIVEQNKPERERGRYLEPGLYDQHEQLGVEWARNSEMMRQRKEQRIQAGQSMKRRTLNDR